MFSFFVMSKNKEFSHSVTFRVQMRQREKGTEGEMLSSPPHLTHSASSQLPSSSITKAVEGMDDAVLKVITLTLFAHSEIRIHETGSVVKFRSPKF